MAATVGTLYLRGQPNAQYPKGRPYTLSIYNAASAAVGTYIKADWNSPASSTSPDFFTVPELVDVVDFAPGAATGVVEFTSDGRRTNVQLDYASFQSSISNRPTGALPQLGPGKLYRLLVTTALPA